MEILSITLDSKSERYYKFLKKNNHLKIQNFNAIIGKNLSAKEILAENLATKDFLYDERFFSYGAIGCAASHKAIWKKSIDENKKILVLEDDCCTHPKIEDFIEKNIKILNECDICFFGMHTNSVIKIKTPQGLQFSSIGYNPAHPTYEWIKNAFNQTDIKHITFNKLIIGFGFWCYYITPIGAKKLIELIFPLSLKKTEIPLINSGQSRIMPLISIDRSGCAIYKQINALITYPFLAYNPNKNISTTEHNIEFNRLDKNNLKMIKTN